MKKGLWCILTLLMLFVVFVSNAQKYTQGAFAEYTQTSFMNKKVSFQMSGEKLVSYGVVPNEEAETQTIQVKLFNPDYTLFKEMSYVIPDTVMVNMHEGGIKVFENIESGNPVFYFAYNSNDGEDFTTGNKATVIREDGVKTCTGFCSWMGFKIVNLDGTHKLVADRQEVDTFHYELSGWQVSETYQFGTSAVYNIQTGLLEYAFPRGTTVISVDKVNGSYKYFTTNDYLSRSLNPHDHWGSVLDPTKVTEYNADFTVWAEVQAPISHFSLPGYEISNPYLFQPVIAGNTVYYIHQVTYSNENYDYKTYTYLSDQSGNVLSTTDRSCYSVWHFGDESNVNVQYLSGLQKFAIINYDVAYSLPELDSIGSYNASIKDEKGGMKFVQYTRPEVRILNDDFSPYKSFLVSEIVENFNGVSQLDIVDDDAFEFLFNAGDSLVVYNENGKLLMCQNINPLSTGMFGSGVPIIFNFKDEKYGRFSSYDGYQYVRTMPLFVRFNQENEPTGNVQLYRIQGDSVVAYADTLIDQQLAVFDVPEGKWAVKTEQTNAYLGTYFPGALMWEQASKIDITADEDSLIDMVRIPVPAVLNPQETAGVIGKLIRSGVISGDFPKATIYVKQASNQSIIASQVLTDSVYSIQHLPNGTFKILVDIPGYTMKQEAQVVLNNNQLNNIDFSVLTNTKEIEAQVPTALKTLNASGLLIYPNPVAESFTWKGMEAEAMVQIVDALGHVVMEQKLSNAGMNVSNLPSGVYFVRGMKNGILVQARLVKK